MTKIRNGKKSLLRLTAAFLMAFMVLACLAPAPPVRAAQSLQEIQKALKEVRAQKNSLADKKNKLSGDLAYLEKRSQAQRQVVEDALEQKEAALMLLEMNQEAAVIAQADYEEKLALYGDRVARMYEWNRLSLFELLLSSQNLQGFFTTLRFMKMVAEADEQALTELEEASVLARQLEEEAADQYSEMIELVLQAEAAMEAIRTQENQTAKELKDLASKLKITQQKEAQLARDAQKPPSPPPANIQNSSGWRGTGPFVWPLPDASYVTSVFGWRAKYGRYHYGTDVAAPVGTRIVAMADGVVTYAGWPGTAYHWAYGIMIVVDHGNGYQTRYGHLSRLNCYMGQRVKAGDVIGYTGNTGRSSGPHLHFETRVNGVPKDPLSYFRRR